MGNGNGNVLAGVERPQRCRWLRPDTFDEIAVSLVAEKGPPDSTGRSDATPFPRAAQKEPLLKGEENR